MLKKLATIFTLCAAGMLSGCGTPHTPTQGHLSLHDGEIDTKQLVELELSTKIGFVNSFAVIEEPISFAKNDQPGTMPLFYSVPMAHGEPKLVASPLLIFDFNGNADNKDMPVFDEKDVTAFGKNDTKPALLRRIDVDGEPLYKTRITEDFDPAMVRQIQKAHGFAIIIPPAP